LVSLVGWEQNSLGEEQHSFFYFFEKQIKRTALPCACPVFDELSGPPHARLVSQLVKRGEPTIKSEFKTLTQPVKNSGPNEPVHFANFT